MAGGVFGLLGGYLTDRFGRRRVLVWSILLYAFSALAAGFATSAWWLLFFRTTTFVGVCVEFVAAVAWLAELFPDPKRREAVLGYTQAFSSIGGLLVTGAYYLAVTYGDSLPAMHGAHAPWRYTLMSGVIPALPLIIIRPFLPESPAWRAKKEAGTLKRPSLAAIFQGDLRRTTIVTTLMFACSYGAAFGAIQHMPRIVPGLAEVATCPRPAQQKIVSTVQAWQEVGGLVGRFLLAFLAVRILARRRLLRMFQIPGLVIVPLVFLYAARYDLDLLKWGIFLAGLAHHRAVQLLGELPAARVPHAPARHGRELRRQRGRAHDRHLGRAGHDAARQGHAGLIVSGSARSTIRRCAGDRTARSRSNGSGGRSPASRRRTWARRARALIAAAPAARTSAFSTAWSNAACVSPAAVSMPPARRRLLSFGSSASVCKAPAKPRPLTSATRQFSPSRRYSPSRRGRWPPRAGPRHRLERHEAPRLLPANREQHRVGGRRTRRPAPTGARAEARPARRRPAAAPARAARPACASSSSADDRRVASSGRWASASMATSMPLRGSIRPMYAAASATGSGSAGREQPGSMPGVGDPGVAQFQPGGAAAHELADEDPTRGPSRLTPGRDAREALGRPRERRAAGRPPNARIQRRPRPVGHPVVADHADGRQAAPPHALDERERHAAHRPPAYDVGRSSDRCLLQHARVVALHGEPLAGPEPRIRVLAPIPAQLASHVGLVRRAHRLREPVVGGEDAHLVTGPRRCSTADRQISS